MFFGGDRDSRGWGRAARGRSTDSSNPPGERGSSRTTPVTATLVSWVSAPERRPGASGTSFLDRTPCTVPVPSRSTRNAILPLDRVVTTQPRTVTVSPTCARSSLIRTAAMPVPLMKRGDVAGSVESSPPPGGRQRGLRARAGRAAPRSRRSRRPARRRRRSGAPRPAAASPAGSWSPARPSTAASVDRKVYAVDLASGQMRWSSRLGGLIGGGVLVLGRHRLRGQRPVPRAGSTRSTRETGRRLWRTTTGPVGAPLALVDGMLVAETQRGEVLGLDPATGAVRWRRTVGVARIPAVAGRQRHRWSWPPSTRCSASARATARSCAARRSPGAIVSPWLAAPRTARGRARPIRCVVAIDPRDLRPRLAGRARRAGARHRPRRTGDTLYAASRRGTRLSHRSPDSAPAATPVAELDWPVTAPVTVLDGLVLLGGADGTLRALRPDGSEAWRLQLSLAGRARPAGAGRRAARHRRRRRPPPVPPMIRFAVLVLALLRRLAAARGARAQGHRARSSSTANGCWPRARSG